MRPMVAAVAADEPETAAKIPQLNMLTCSSLPGSLERPGDKPSNKSWERRVRNRISPIQINKGSAVSDQPVVALQDEVPSNNPILLLSIRLRPMIASPVSVSDTQMPLVNINSMQTTRIPPIRVISMGYSTLLISSSFRTYWGVSPSSMTLRLSSIAMNRNSEPTAIGVCTIHNGTTR